MKFYRNILRTDKYSIARKASHHVRDDLKGEEAQLAMKPLSQFLAGTGLLDLVQQTLRSSSLSKQGVSGKDFPHV